jgi:hypothetical protein
MGTSNARFLLGILVGLLFGGGLTYLLLDQPADAVIELSDSPPERNVLGRVGAREASVLTAPPATATNREVANVPAAAPITDARVSELIERIDIEPMETKFGIGAITGSVVDESGAPLAGAVIRIERQESGRGGTDASEIGGAVPEPESIEDVVRRAAERFETRRANRREAQSDISGQFRIDGLGEANWSVVAYLEGYELSSKTRLYRVATDSVLSFTARRVVQIPVRVVEASGAVPEAVFLQCDPKTDGARRQRLEWTPDRAFLRLGVGGYTIQAHWMEVMTSGESERSSEALELTVSATEAHEPLHFELRGRAGIRGRIRVSGESVGADRLIVRMMPLAPGQDVDLEQLRRTRTIEHAGPNEEWTFTDLEAGRYVVGTARDYSAPIAVHRVVEVADEMVVCDLELPPIDLAKSLTVMALDAHGVAVEGLDLHLGSKEERMYFFNSGGNALRTPDGAYIVELEPKLAEAYFGNGDSNDEYTLYANHRELGNREFDVARGTTELTITIATPGTLMVAVPGYQGSGLEGRLTVACTKLTGGKPDGRIFFPNRELLDADGTKELEGLEPGSYRVLLTLQAEGSVRSYYDTRTLDMTEVVISAGENRAVLNIPALYDLRVRWPDGKAGARLWLKPEDDSVTQLGQLNVQLDEDSLALFEEMPAGHYMLTTGGGVSTLYMRVTIPSDELEFAPIAVDCLRVVIEDDTGDYAKIGLRTGDLIVGVDGVEFDGTPSRSIFSELYRSKSASLILLVERGGERIELSVRGSDVGDGSHRGGELVPDQR